MKSVVQSFTRYSLVLFLFPASLHTVAHPSIQAWACRVHSTCSLEDQQELLNFLAIAYEHSRATIAAQQAYADATSRLIALGTGIIETRRNPSKLQKFPTVCDADMIPFITFMQERTAYEAAARNYDMLLELLVKTPRISDQARELLEEFRTIIREACMEQCFINCAGVVGSLEQGIEAANHALALLKQLKSSPTRAILAKLAHLWNKGALYAYVQYDHAAVATHQQLAAAHSGCIIANNTVWNSLAHTRALVARDAYRALGSCMQITVHELSDIPS